MSVLDGLAPAFRVRPDHELKPLQIPLAAAIVVHTLRHARHGMRRHLGPDVSAVGVDVLDPEVSDVECEGSLSASSRGRPDRADRKSTRLNSSHVATSY